MKRLKKLNFIKIATSIFLGYLLVSLSSCVSKYSGSHQNFDLFNKDVAFCLNKACKKKSKNVFLNLSIIPPALAYGGGGGGGMSDPKNDISYKKFNICMSERGYSKDKNGLFKLPILTCS